MEYSKYELYIKYKYNGMEKKIYNPEIEVNTSADLKASVFRIWFCKGLLLNPNFSFPIQFLVLLSEILATGKSRAVDA